jgi:hypothetical protein
VWDIWKGPARRVEVLQPLIDAGDLVLVHPDCFEAAWEEEATRERKTTRVPS